MQITSVGIFYSSRGKKIIIVSIHRQSVVHKQIIITLLEVCSHISDNTQNTYFLNGSVKKQKLSKVHNI